MPRHQLTSWIVSGAAIATVVALALASSEPAAGGDGVWSLQIEGVFTDAWGHDQHVLTTQRVDLASATTSSSAGSLDTDATFGYHVDARWSRDRWGLGLDFVWFKSNQSGPDARAAADGAAGPVHALLYEVAGRSFTSNGPAEVLYFSRLEDTAVAMWTADLFAIRSVAEGPKSRVDVLFGIRNADFDNDYRVIVGVEDVGGTRIDASSNYDRMIGPFVGLEASFDLGHTVVGVHLAQAVQLGSVELTNRTRDYTGPSADYAVPAEEATGFDSEESLHVVQDVAIPVTELRLRWAYRFTDRISAGLGAHASTWWDVPVPPGVVPGPDGNRVLHENTIVFFGLAAGVEVRF